MNDSVYMNVEAIKEDMKRLNITAKQVSLSLGLSDNALSGMFFAAEKKGAAYKRENIARIEKALFREPGAYCIEKKDVSEKKTAESPNGGANSKDIADAFMQLLAIDNKILVELKNMNEAMKELLMNVRGDTSTGKEYMRRIHDNVLKISEELK